MVQRYRANRPQQYIKILKEVTIKAIRSRTLRVKELILIKDTNSIIDLIKQVIKINNRIFQRERANKGNNNRTMPVYKVPQQV